MPKQYGSNGINSDGSLMNVGNKICDPENGGRPSIRLHSDKNAMARTTPPWLIGVENETTEEKKNQNQNQNQNQNLKLSENNKILKDEISKKK